MELLIPFGLVAVFALAGLGAQFVRHRGERKPEATQIATPALKALGEGIARSVDATLELKRQEIDRFNARRDVEWRVSIAVWASFAFIANAGSELQPSRWQLILFAVGVALFASGHAAWVFVHSIRNDTAEINRNRGVELDNAVRIRLGLPTATELPAYNRLAHLWPAAVTFLLGSGVVFVMAIN